MTTRINLGTNFVKHITWKVPKQLFVLALVAIVASTYQEGSPIFKYKIWNNFLNKCVQ